MRKSSVRRGASSRSTARAFFLDALEAASLHRGIQNLATYELNLNEAELPAVSVERCVVPLDLRLCERPRLSFNLPRDILVSALEARVLKTLGYLRNAS